MSRWPVQVAIQTISWGDVSKHAVDGMLGEVKDAGYAGVEFYQQPSEIDAPEVVYKLLRQHDLHLVGMAGGSLEDKIDFVKAFMKVVANRSAKDRYSSRYSAPPYINVVEWRNKNSQQALNDGMRLALHPHMFSAVQTWEDAEKLLAAHPKLEFLPDTAHLTVAGADLLEVLGETLSRVAAIHLKDWSREFGRAYQFYSGGFTNLGDGDVMLDAVLKLLNEHSFHGWLVVEQDASDRPMEEAKKSREWLRKHYGI